MQHPAADLKKQITKLFTINQVCRIFKMVLLAESISG